MPPVNKEEEQGEMIVQKVGNDSLKINGQTFTFDSVADIDSTQLDVFQLVGLPLIENCLAGFTSLVFAYGQTGSGKTYTMWGPANALLEENLSSDQQGLTPRIFVRPFSRINEEQIKHAEKQLNYQCHCSFLEIYNEQIADLLDPSQRNLQIREDVKSGVYVENLTEEYVCAMKDVTQLLIKSKADGISRFKTSRINLVDLAGSERQKLTGAAGERLKEARNMVLSHSLGKQRHIPYRDSRLTFSLQESLGGNAKLAMICAVSPAQSCKSETFSTLRFAQRAKAIKSKAVVNEVMQDDVNYLREVIQQLRVCSCGKWPESDRHKWRRSEIDEDTVEKICDHVDMQLAGGEDSNKITEGSVETIKSHSKLEVSENGSFSEPQLNTLKLSVLKKKLSADSHVWDSSVQPPLEKKTLSSSVSGLPDKGSLSNSFELMYLQFLSLQLQVFHPELTIAGKPEDVINAKIEAIIIQVIIKTTDFQPVFPVAKVDFGVQTSQNDEMPKEDTELFLCNHCKNRMQLDVKERNDSSNLQLVPFDDSQSADKYMKQVPKAVEKVLAGAIRREMALEDFCAKQTSEIKHLNRLYKHERECNAFIGQTREDKILCLESLMDVVLPTEEFMEEEFVSLVHEHKFLKEKFENHPEILRTKIELNRVQERLEQYRNFCDLGEREVLPPLTTIPKSAEDSAEEKLERERIHWTEVESKWISLTEELRIELEASRSLAEKQKQELDAEKQCTKELKEAMQMAMEGHARMLEQYVDLEEKHIQLLARHRKIQEGIDNVKKAATRAGVRSAESKFINAIAAEISALKAEREKERRYLRDENKGLQAQLWDTAEAVKAAGEVLVRLKEAEEAVAAAQVCLLLC
ncbi:hypothetical protein Pint_20842 [Pistacia integerrima]|uniref:Uncharacterized protein n=1 Tax=Pistacia integerrima TaxID=434235 RepID=A0ACC0XEL7_9ROSI|nr:hypothetical protein Pint_20842 [Pistacia integerrima]